MPSPLRIIMRFWETSQLPLPWPNINTNLLSYYHLGKNVRLGEGLVGSLILRC